MTRLRLRVPSPGLVVSLVALIVALGGTSYAAFSVPKGSVGTKQLKNKAVTNAKLGPLSVGNAKIRDGAVTASKINPTGLTVPNATNANTATNASNANNAVTAAAANGLSGLQIAAAPDVTLAGLPGPGGGVAPGPGQVPAGPASVPKGNEQANCPPGQVALSGGEVNDSPGTPGAVMVLNQVAIRGSSVTVIVQNGGSAAVRWHAYAVCITGTSTGSSN